MIIPSIDLAGGHAVQLVGGREQAIDAGDPMPIAERFARVGEIAVVDLDAAIGTGDNRAVIESLVRRFPCRVGGGIRDRAAAVHWLDAGASSIVVGTAASPAFFDGLPRERCVAALDAEHGEVMVEGWRAGTGTTITDRMAELRDHVGGFLVTIIEREGRLAGVDLEQARQLRDAAGDAKLVLAGGVTTPQDVRELDRLGIDAQVGMALYTGRLPLWSAVAACIEGPEDGPWPTVITDEHGIALGLAWSRPASLEAAIEGGRGVYWSRSRDALWEKGATSGATQTLHRVALDCDRDALRFTVSQAGPGFCHEDTRTCWGEDDGLPRLARRLADIAADPPAGSYTARLFGDPALLAAKLREEAGELADALAGESDARVAEEAGDVIYFAMAAMAARGIDLRAVADVLERRSRRVTRRAGDAKPGALAGSGERKETNR
jgi:phosphoribosyl-ATP pyrophosphohydrolase